MQKNKGTKGGYQLLMFELTDLVLHPPDSSYMQVVISRNENFLGSTANKSNSRT
jgi:hypothetical protein